MTQKESHEMIIKIHQILTGNGDIGLCEQVRSNKTDIVYIKDKIKNMPKNWRSWLTFGITVLTFLLMAFLAYNK